MTAIQAVTAAVWNTPPHPREDYDERVASRAIDAFLAHLDKAGWVIVPKRPWSEMIPKEMFQSAKETHRTLWEAQLSVAPEFDPETM